MCKKLAIGPHTLLQYCVLTKKKPQVSSWAWVIIELNSFLSYLSQAFSSLQAPTSSSWTLSHEVPMLIVVFLSLDTQPWLGFTWYHTRHPYLHLLYTPAWLVFAWCCRCHPCLHLCYRWMPLNAVVLCKTILIASSIHIYNYIWDLMLKPVRYVMSTGPSPYKLPSI